MISAQEKDIRLKKDTAIIVEGILSTMSSAPQTILLCGGYGRNEGAWFRNEVGEVCPYNDYDLAVITECPLSREAYSKLRKELASKVGIKWIDIDFYTSSQIKRMKATIHNIDLFYASKVLWGDENWADTYKTLDPVKIGKDDIIKLYTTRMWTFLGSFEGGFHDMNLVDSRFFRNQMAKAVLAACDMRIVALKKYTTSYKERVEIVTKEFSDNNSLTELAYWAIKEKTEPSNENISKDEMVQLYSNAYDLFSSSFEYAMGKEAGEFLQPDKTMNYFRFRTFYYLYVVYGWLKGYSWISKSYEIMCAQNYVFRAYRDNEFYDINYLERASAILLKWKYINHMVSDWHQLRIIVANARNNL